MPPCNQQLLECSLEKSEGSRILKVGNSKQEATCNYADGVLGSRTDDGVREAVRDWERVLSRNLDLRSPRNETKVNISALSSPMTYACMANFYY